MAVALLAGYGIYRFVFRKPETKDTGREVTLRSDIKGQFTLDDMRKAVREKDMTARVEEPSPVDKREELEELQALIRENEGSFYGQPGTEKPAHVAETHQAGVKTPPSRRPSALEKKKDSVQVRDSASHVPPKPGRRGFNSIRLIREEEKNVIRAFVHSTQTVSVGSTLKMQVAENCLTDDGRRIRKGTPVYGEVESINGERVQVRITSVNLDGNILPFHKDVYSEDAIEGIYVPGNVKAEAAQDAGAAAVRGADTHVSGGLDMGSQLVAGAANSVVNAAKSVAGKNIKKVKVTIKTNYRILLKGGKQ